MKHAYFNSTDFVGWPDPSELAPYFLGPGRRWFDTGGNDSAGFVIEGVEGTAHLQKYGGRRDIELGMWGFPDHGVMLSYHSFVIERRDGEVMCYSKGDHSLLRKHVRTLHNDPVPLGLIIPFEQAFLAVKEFIETDGRLPKSIAWVHENDLPEGTFPLP